MESSDVMRSMGVLTRAALTAWMTIRPNDDGGEDEDGVKVMCPVCVPELIIHFGIQSLGENMLTTRKSTKESQRYSHSDQPSSSSKSPNNEWQHRTGRISGIQYVSDDNEYGDSHFTRGDTEKMERYDEKIIHHERSTIQVIPDGTVTTIPHARHLPNEILACIIDHVAEQPNSHDYKYDGRWFKEQNELYTFTLVNKQFYSVANHLLWQKPVLKVGRRHMLRLLDCLAAAKQPMGQYIRRLVLKNTTCDDTQLLLLMTHISHLETLSIENVDFTDKFSPITSRSLERLPRHCPRLSTLQLINIQTSIDTSRAIVHYCHHLTELTMNCGYALMTSANIFQRNIKKMDSTMVLWPHLRKLRLEDAIDIDSPTFVYFIETHPHLQLIHLEDALLMDASLDAMTVFLPNLRQLFLGDASEISSGGVRRLIQKCQELVLVQLRQCQFVISDLLETHDDDGDDLYLNENDITKIRGAQKTGNVH
ncbi:hypothetical protein BCR42DRAFT_495912 [Absidia repens]|uniref:Uncharacterized protein n=1 Tax=Absidia repens TaxID=90262 RepID=A0A1X2I1N4_9FUNG|nr:hypothetical protein BCR42DRAFT_495912 [Absidia repens]